MAEVAVEYLIRKLRDRILFETDKRRAAELNAIKIEFGKIRPFLKSADWRKMMTGDNAIAKWVADVTSLVYVVEDVIDSDCSRRKDTNGLSLSSLVEFVSESFSYRTTSTKLQTSYKSLLMQVSQKLKELEDKRKHLSLYGDISKASHENMIQHSKYSLQKIPLNNMVGRSKEFVMLKELLVHGVEVDKLDLVTVTGKEGIGKTTLVLRVYEHVQRHFDCSAWISVCGCSITGILRNMAIDFSKNHPAMKPVSNLDKMRDKDLANMVHDYLSGKNFLLVLDGLDTLNAFEDIKCALPTICRGKVVMTTSNTAFPAVICKHVLHLEPLLAEDGLELLHRRALLQQHSELPWPSSMKSVAKKILLICQGIPLAIVAIGSLLSTMNLEELENWNKVFYMLEEADGCLPQSSLIKKVITVSYFSLPGMLKCCFLYCGMFPHHSDIQCKRLIRLWVAEGFTGRQLFGMTEEESAKSFLEELIQRNLLEMAQVGLNGEVESCRLLKPVRDFIYEMSQKDQIFYISECARQVGPSRPLHFVAIHGKIDHEMHNSLPIEIRSLHVFHGEPLQTTVLLSLVSKVKLLHVLNLRDIPVDALPDEIGDLVHLRYLDLRNTKLHELPSSLQNLCELQTLDVRNTQVRALPSGFDSLKMLKHLLLANSHGNRVVKSDAEIMFLKDLQTLAGVKLTQNVAAGLNHLPKLLKLSVGEVEGGKNSLLLSESINQMKDLNSLTIKCAWRKEIQVQISNPLDNLEKLRVGGWIKDLLSWVSRLNSLKYLHIWDCMLSEDPISNLQHLPNLIVLSLSKAYRGKQICCDNGGGFPKLKRLSISHFEELAEWIKIEEGAMQRLQSLTIGYCRKLSSPPKGLENLKHLVTLQITSMSPEFAEEAKAISHRSGLTFSVVDQVAHQQNNLPKHKIY